MNTWRQSISIALVGFTSSFRRDTARRKSVRLQRCPTSLAATPMGSASASKPAETTLLESVSAAP